MEMVDQAPSSPALLSSVVTYMEYALGPHKPPVCHLTGTKSFGMVGMVDCLIWNVHVDGLFEGTVFISSHVLISPLSA